MLQAQTPTFQHVVIIVQENRISDNLFQGLCAPPFGSAESCSASPKASQYEIQTNDWSNKNTFKGVTEPLPVPLANKYDLSHAHSAFVAMCNGDPVTNVCEMNGAASVKGSGKSGHFRSKSGWLTRGSRLTVLSRSTKQVLD